MGDYRGEHACYWLKHGDHGGLDVVDDTLKTVTPDRDTTAVIVKSEGDEVYSDEEDSKGDIDATAEENVEKIKLENDLHDDSLTIRGRYLDISNPSKTGNDTSVNDTLVKLYDKTGYNITMEDVNNLTIF